MPRICCRVESRSSSVSLPSWIPLARFRSIALNAASQGLAIDVAKQDLVARARCHLRNSVSHGACANDADRFNSLRGDACVQSFPLVSVKL